jgi:transcriptional regulator with XRE-family HTH domain
MNLGRAGRHLGDRLWRHAEPNGDASERNAALPDALGDGRRSDVAMHTGCISQKSELGNPPQKPVIARVMVSRHDEEMTGDALRQHLRKVMEKHGIKSPYDWANRAGKPRSTTLAEFMNGKNDSLNSRTLAWMAKALEITVAELLGQEAVNKAEIGVEAMAAALAGIREELGVIRQEQSNLLREILEALKEREANAHENQTRRPGGKMAG